MATPPSTDRRIWDLPVRLVHWSFALLLPAMWWTAEEGDIETHVTLGLVTLALVLFRLLWGLWGSETARFASFIRGPAAIRDYLRAAPAEVRPGHNPLGALSVVALLGLLAVQVSIGLFTQDVDGLESGPLSYLVSYDFADGAREWHELGFNLLLALVGLHLAAIAWYRLRKRQNLVGPMITGKGEATTALRFAPAWLALATLAISGAVAWWIGQGAPLP